MPAPANRPQHLRLALLAFALLVLGCKLLLIAGFASSTPVTDQWDIAWFTLRPWLLGQLNWQELFQSHYEHRQVTTRLLDLALLQANGRIWNPLLEMVVNALVHVTTLVLFLAVLLRACPPAGRRSLLLFATLLCSLPYDYENTLNGYQSQVYLALLFALGSLLLLLRQPAFSGRWWLGLLLGLLADLSSAAGAVVFAVAAPASLLWPSAAPAETRRRRSAALLLAVLALAVILTTPRDAQTLLEVTPGAQRQLLTDSHSLGSFLQALWLTSSWPTLALGPLIYAPLLYGGWRLWRQWPEVNDDSRLLAALGLWVLALVALPAWGRAAAPVTSRYTDYFALGLLVCLCCLLRETTSTPPRRSLTWLRRLWYWPLLLVLLAHSSVQFNTLTHFMMPGAAASTASVRAYLESGDPAELTTERHPLLPPVPTPGEMRLLLDDPTVRSLLPPPLMPAHAQRQGLWAQWLLAGLHVSGLLLLLAGTALAAALRWRPVQAAGSAT